MRLFIDTEFNEFGGELISLALVAEDGSEFYEVLECRNPTPWVAKNVMPILGKEPILRYMFKAKLQAFLKKFDSVHIVADWPDDIKYFCEELITGPGNMIGIRKFTCEVNRNLDTKNSKILHNALEDARAICTSYLNQYYDKDQ